MRLLSASIALVACLLLGPATQAQALSPEEVAIRAALSPLPAEFRASAVVLTRDAAHVLRPGDGPFICLADDPGDDRFHVACYHRSLEPFMARGRELRADGHVAEVDSLREAEIAAGQLAMPDHPAALYSLTGPPESVDQTTGEVTRARPLFVVYVPFATAVSTGLSTRPRSDAPWLMDAGTAKAHIMFAPDMR